MKVKFSIKNQQAKQQRITVVLPVFMFYLGYEKTLKKPLTFRLRTSNISLVCIFLNDYLFAYEKG